MAWLSVISRSAGVSLGVDFDVLRSGNCVLSLFLPMFANSNDLASRWGLTLLARTRVVKLFLQPNWMVINGYHISYVIMMYTMDNIGQHSKQKT